MRWQDPYLGPLLSAVIWFLMFALGFLVIGVLFSRNAAIAGGAIGVLAPLLGLAIQARGKAAEARKENGP